MSDHGWVTTGQAKKHAERASELLATIERDMERVADLTEMQRLELAGIAGQVNADLQWTRELAVAHALTAQALAYAYDHRR